MERDLLKRAALSFGQCMLCSMSRKGDWWDNAPIESFFATLKGELVEGADYQTCDHARADDVPRHRRRLQQAPLARRAWLHHTRAQGSDGPFSGKSRVTVPRKAGQAHRLRESELRRLVEAGRR
jgi:transposase InsO family protein